MLQIKAIQKGTDTLSSGVANISLNDVVDNKTITVAYCRGNLNSPTNYLIRADLTDVDNLRLDINGTSSVPIIDWFVIEFTSASDIIVQRGLTSMPDLTTDITISAVSALTKAFNLFHLKNAGTALDEDDFIKNQISTCGVT